jgi:ribosomal protein S18 acetylase RimI-like enzyme
VTHIAWLVGSMGLFRWLLFVGMFITEVKSFSGGDFMRLHSEEARKDILLSPPEACTSCVIRPADWNDLGEVSNLIVSEFLGTGNGGLRIWHGAHTLSQLNRLQQNFTERIPGIKHRMLVAMDAGNQAVGFVDIDARERKGGFPPPRPYLSDLAVSSSKRRQGIGSLLVQHCEGLCVEWGFDKIHLKVQDANAGGIAFYESLQYVQVSERDSAGQILLMKRLHP